MKLWKLLVLGGGVGTVVTCIIVAVIYVLVKSLIGAE